MVIYCLGNLSKSITYFILHTGHEEEINKVGITDRKESARLLYF